MRWLPVFLALSLFADPSFALRCGNNIVKKGDTTMSLIKYCGEPTTVEQFENRVPVETYDATLGKYVLHYDTQPYEVWTYNFGRQRFITRITIRKGSVQKIETGGYGF
jgi:hypothetical protein